MRIYIAGPMRGYPNFNFAAFDDCRDWLLLSGHTPISPADHDREVQPDIEQDPAFATGDIANLQNFDYHAAMRWDLSQVAGADAIVMLPGWERSTGAGHEHYVAKACGHQVYLWADGALLREQTVNIIGVAGYARAGKDTVGGIMDALGGYKRVSFADKLRHLLLLVDPYVKLPSVHEMSTQRLSQVIHDRGWEWAKDFTDARTYLQDLGSGARQLLGDTVWVNAALDLRPGSYVVTDVRYPNEGAAIKAMGGEVWRVERPGHGPVNDHPSETAMDDFDYDYVIPNDGDLNDLTKLVEYGLFR